MNEFEIVNCPHCGEEHMVSEIHGLETYPYHIGNDYTREVYKCTLGCMTEQERLHGIAERNG